MSARSALLLAAALFGPLLWGWLLPPLLARIWPRRPASPDERPALPDYEI